MTSTTPTSAKAWAPDQISDLDIDAALPDLFLVKMTTKAGEVDGDEPSVRVPYVSADPVAATVAEGQPITPTDAARDEVVISTHKSAVLSIVSNELIRQPGAQERLTKSMERAVVSKVNTDFVAALATASADFVDGGVLGENLDALSDAIADIAANGGDASHIVMPSSAWKSLSKVKSSTGSAVPLLGTGSGTEGFARSIFGVPVVLAANATAVYVTSKSDLLSAYGRVSVAVSEDAYFGSDSTGLRATLRFGVAAARPERHAVIALA
jgi:HK97 family phage major capsid protein